MSLAQSLILAVLGLANGLVSAISGGGGGLFVLPLMVATLSDPHDVLIGSVFVAYLVSSVSGLIAYARRGLVDYKTGAILAIPTIPGVVIGTFLETSIPDFEFTFGLGLITIVLSLTMYLTQIKTRASSNPTPSSHQRTENGQTSFNARNIRVITDRSGRIFTYTPKLVMGALLNFAAGLISGTFGAGAAIIIVPAMIMFVRMPGHVAIASSRIVLLALNVGAIATHVSTGAINYLYALALSVGAIVGIYFGAKVVFKMSPTFLTKIMVAIYVLIGAYLVASSF